MNMKAFLVVVLSTVHLASVAQDRPRRDYELHEEAESLYNDGHFSRALALLDQCLKQNPGYMEAYALRAAVREQMNDQEGALTDYSIFLERYPDRVDVLMSRAVLRFNIGYYEQAREDLQHLLLLPPPGETNVLLFKKSASVNDRSPIVTTTQGQHVSYLLNYLGLVDMKLGNFQSARHYLDSAIQRNPREPDYFVNRGLVKEKLGDSTAYLDYQTALVLNPGHTLAKHNLKALNAGHDIEASEEARLTQTIEADSTMLYPYLERAQQRYQSKYYEGAIDDYTSALEIDSTDVEIWLGRGLALEKVKDYRGAFSDYTRAIDLQPDFAKAWLNRGNVLVKLDRFEDAIEDYTVALIYYPDYALAFYNRAMALLRLKRNEEACGDLQKAQALGMDVDEKVKSHACEK